MNVEDEMTRRLILVDYENIGKVDLSLLDNSYRAIIFVGAKQNTPKASRKPSTAHRFSRVDFQKIEGVGKNALDFHIAFQLGRTFETAPETQCIVLSKDKGFDPLLAYLNKNGLVCQRIAALEELLLEELPESEAQALENACKRCGKASCVEHLGGQWCSYCGNFSSPPDPQQMPSCQAKYREKKKDSYGYEPLMGTCAWCHQRTDMSGGIYDDGEWMCSDCISGYAR
ncbi:PIN domain-containing protein [Pseudomonas sp. C11]|uniref:PIN domain-containing protein n=1 Tax=Pseudomonas sp. C11 TaxID=3075550 RepID=UPI002AFE4221|nr:PIN domain-containing protein [Pseudomonas sp. C11]